MLGVYVHIPYCRTRCYYCDFVSRAVDGAVPETYIDALCREIADFRGPDAAATVFLGGGTPSLLAPASVERVLTALRRRLRFEDPETTIESNPDDITPDLVRAWADLGINRVSIGVQSFDDLALQYLGRRHNAETAFHACEIVAKQFANWSVDLIFGAHPVESWEPTILKCAVLAPPHVSAYGLTYEDHTVFGARACEEVDEELALSLYQLVEDTLAGYDHYEISNFARPGRTCKHNLIYWRNGEYVGFGAGAVSYLDGVRSRNFEEHEVYAEHPGRKAEVEDLTRDEIRTETLIQHFRLREGIQKADYLQRFGRDIRDDFGPVIDALILRHLLDEDEESIHPTRAGFYLNDEIGLALVE